MKALHTHKSNMNTTTVQEVIVDTLAKNKVFTSLFWDKLDWPHLQDMSRMETCYAFLLFLGHKSLQLGGILLFRETPEGLRGLENAKNSTVVWGLIQA